MFNLISMIMKKLLLFSLFAAGLFLNGIAKDPVRAENSEQVVVDNDKVRVVEFVSTPGKDVCGAGMHSHDAHLTIVLTDGKVKITTKEGESQELELKSGTSIWFDPDTHKAVNSGSTELKVLLVYLK